MSYTKELQAAANEYFREHPGSECTAREIAHWAILTGRLKPHGNAAERQLANDLSRAMREEHRTDPQGRSVRAKHVARVKRKGKQLNLWADSQTAPPAHMKIAFQQRRQQIVGDCLQLKVDVDSYNDNRDTSAGQLMLIGFDFRNDLAEIEALRRSKAA